MRGRYEMGPMVTVIDIPKFTRLREMLGPFYEAQVQNADVLILNKVDLATAADLETARKAVVELNEHAELMFTEQCELDVNKIIAGATSQKMADYADSHGIEVVQHRDHGQIHDHGHGHDHDHHDDHRHAPAQSFVLDAEGSAGRHAMEAFFFDIPDNVWRAKGYTRLDSQLVLIQFTMGQLDITEAEPRENHHMVFIGPDMDRDIIEKDFRALYDAAKAVA